MVAAKKPIVLIEIFRQMQQKCNFNQPPPEEWLKLDTFAEYDAIKNILTKIKCTTNATTEALKDSDLAQPLEELEKDLNDLIGSLKACENKPTILEKTV